MSFHHFAWNSPMTANLCWIYVSPRFSTLAVTSPSASKADCLKSASLIIYLPKVLFQVFGIMCYGGVSPFEGVGFCIMENRVVYRRESFCTSMCTSSLPSYFAEEFVLFQNRIAQ